MKTEKTSSKGFGKKRYPKNRDNLLGTFPEYVPLPDAPKSTSRVPSLTSIHGRPGRGNYGDPSYRGNCSGLLIRDLLNYFRPRNVFDPMTGGGTCRDVCSELGITCDSRDIQTGFDATDGTWFETLPKYDFVWLHPPYWRLIRWSDHPQCLANAPTLESFLSKLQVVIANCACVLSERGILAILIGDARVQGHYQGLPFRTFACAEAAGLELAAPEIIRFSHGATSAKQHYDFPLIPRLHDVCLVFRRAERG